MSGAHMYHKERPVISKDEALIKAKELAKQLECVDDNWLECLRQMPAEKLVAENEIFFPVDGTEFLPLIAHKAFEQAHFNKGYILLTLI